jgi:hypothetical protein
MPHVEVNKLYYLRDNVAFDPVLLAGVCNSCGQTFNTIQVILIANPEISEAWVNKYFHRNEIIEEPEIPCTVTLSQNDPSNLPSCWRLWRTETAEGFVDQHFLPIAGHYAGGENGLQSCSGESIWEDAADLIEAAWPALVKLSGSALPCRFEFEPSLPVERNDFSKALLGYQAEADAKRARIWRSKRWKFPPKLRKSAVVCRMFEVDFYRDEKGWKPRLTENSRTTLPRRKLRGRTWRKDQAMAKRRGKIHLRRYLDDFDDDIPF